MSNVEAYKCDICGKVFHKEEKGEDYTCIVRMDFSDTKESDEDKKPECACYDDICPDCSMEVARIIKEPGSFKYMENHINELCEEKHKLRFYLDNIRKVIHYGGFPNGDKELADVIIREYIHLEKSLDKWKLATQLSFGAWAGVIIGLLIIWCI